MITWKIDPKVTTLKRQKFYILFNAKRENLQAKYFMTHQTFTIKSKND